MSHNEDNCGDDSVKWTALLQYLGAASYDEFSIIPEIAGIFSEVLGKWNIFTRELVDDLQCGNTEYRFNDTLLEDSHYYIDDVLFVSAGGVCFTEHENGCGYACHTYEYDDVKGTITLSDPPQCDLDKGLKVRVRYGIDVTEACCLPKTLVRKYGAHIINYMLYKRAIRGADSKTKAQANLLYRDAVEYFYREEWKAFKNISVRTTPIDRVRF